MTFLVRQAFSKVFGQTPDDMDMNVVYDVSHNIAKVGCVCVCVWVALLTLILALFLLSVYFFHSECNSQRTAGRRAFSRRQCKEASRASQRRHARVSPSPPSHSCRLPGVVLLQRPPSLPLTTHPPLPTVYWPTGARWGYNGHVQVHPKLKSSYKNLVLNRACSYVLTGTDKGMAETFGRCASLAFLQLLLPLLSFVIVSGGLRSNFAQHVPRRWSGSESQQKPQRSRVRLRAITRTTAQLHRPHDSAAPSPLAPSRCSVDVALAGIQKCCSRWLTEASASGSLRPSW